MYFLWMNGIIADPSGRAVWGINCLRPLQRWDRGFESHFSYGCLCVRLFCVYVFLCVGSGLATVWSPVQEVLPTVYRIKKLKKRRKPNERAVEPQIDIYNGIIITIWREMEFYCYDTSFSPNLIWYFRMCSRVIYEHVHVQAHSRWLLGTNNDYAGEG
jgi:hypothetical protein